MKNNIRRKNHYVAKMILKRFTPCGDKLSVYRLLVSHSGVSIWKQSTISGIAYHAHLYTQIIEGNETDKIEQWFGSDFEAPADEILNKLTSNQKLSSSEWNKLTRFVAAQDLRTPASYLENIPRWKETIPTTITETLLELREKLSKRKHQNRLIISGNPSSTIVNSNNNDFPLCIKSGIDKNGELLISAGITPGRSLWIWKMKLHLNDTIKTIKPHKWQILIPPEHITWFTSDKPVIRLNHYRHNSYDFNGGWGNTGTEIIMPISPKHLLYAKVGDRNKTNTYRHITEEESLYFRKIIAENAHRYIYSSNDDESIPILRPRIVNHELFFNEKEQWNNWAKDQAIAEQEIMMKVNKNIENSI